MALWNMTPYHAEEPRPKTKARFLSEPSLYQIPLWLHCMHTEAMYLHRASIAVSKPTPHYYIPGVGLPLHAFHFKPYEGGLMYANCEPSES